ncbi:MAG: hypothetical protein JWO67_6275 [Streptosporangiaceae bacterium]|nr:hypothetical protein [Streptosporangiaceae bacterium]
MTSLPPGALTSDLDAYLSARTVEPDDAHSPHR